VPCRRGIKPRLQRRRCLLRRNCLSAYAIILYGSEEQKQKYLPAIAAGKRLAAFGLTESTPAATPAASNTAQKTPKVTFSTAQTVYY